MNILQKTYLRGYNDAMDDVQTFLKAIQDGKDGEAVTVAMQEMQTQKLSAMCDQEGGVS